MKECVNSGKVNFFFLITKSFDQARLLLRSAVSQHIPEAHNTVTNYSTTKTGTKVGKSVTEILNAIAPH